ncbi:hypothetical protein Tco_0198754 [Tanacetum coccineum]
MEHELWNLKVKEYDVVAYTQRFNELALMCPRMVEPERVKVDAYIRGLTDNIKGEVTSSKPADLNEAVRMAHKLMEQKSQARDARILEGNKRKIAKSKEKINAASDEFTAPIVESFLCRERCFYSAMLEPMPKKIKQEEVGEVRGRAYAIKDSKPRGPNVVTVNHVFEIDLMRIELGMFDVIIGMDWLVKHDVVIICGEKVESTEELTTVRAQVEFELIVVRRDAPVTRAPYRLAPSEMKKLTITMVNEIPPDHVDDVPVVEPNQHDDVPVVPEPVLVDEDEGPEEDEFKEEEDPQEEEDDMEIDIEEDENKPELAYPYEEVDHLNPPPPASESELDNEIEVENPIEHEDETVPVSIYEVGESSTVVIPREDGDRLLLGFMRRDGFKNIYEIADPSFMAEFY